MKTVAIVILNYNGKVHLSTFLPSVVAHSQGHRVIVADNGSTDESINYLKENFSAVELIQLDQNYGFCGGYNRALKQVEADYYVLLNSDVEVTSNWIEPIIALMDSIPEIAACQPKILSYTQKDSFEYAGAAGGFVDVLGYPYCRGRIFDTIEKDEGQYNDTRPIFWATGACLFVKSEVYHKLGGFDEDFFAHMEEIDLCWRIQNQGYQVYYCGESTVYHLGGGTLHKSNPKKTYLNFRNNLRSLTKNSSGLFWKLPLRILLDGIAVFKFLAGRQTLNAWAVLKADKDFLIEIKNNLKKRKEIKKGSKNLAAHHFILVQYFLFRRKLFKDLPQ